MASQTKGQLAGLTYAQTVSDIHWWLKLRVTLLWYLQLLYYAFLETLDFINVGVG